jgi:hypothetical protein
MSEVPINTDTLRSTLPLRIRSTSPRWGGGWGPVGGGGWAGGGGGDAGKWGGLWGGGGRFGDEGGGGGGGAAYNRRLGIFCRRKGRCRARRFMLLPQGASRMAYDLH